MTFVSQELNILGRESGGPNPTPLVLGRPFTAGFDRRPSLEPPGPADRTLYLSTLLQFVGVDPVPERRTHTQNLYRHGEEGVCADADGHPGSTLPRLSITKGMRLRCVFSPGVRTAPGYPCLLTRLGRRVGDRLELPTGGET